MHLLIINFCSLFQSSSFYCFLILLTCTCWDGLVTICLTFTMCFVFLLLLHAHCTLKSIQVEFIINALLLAYISPVRLVIYLHKTWTTTALNYMVTWLWNKCLMLLCSIENQTRKVPCNLVHRKSLENCFSIKRATRVSQKFTYRTHQTNQTIIIIMIRIAVNYCKEHKTSTPKVHFSWEAFFL